MAEIVVRLTDPFVDADAGHVVNLAPRQPVELKVTRWKCPTCRRSWSKKATTEKHIKFGCVSDPEVRACMTCKHYHQGDCNAGLSVARPIPRRCPLWERERDWYGPMDG